MKKQTEKDLKMVREFYIMFKDKPRYARADEINTTISKGIMSDKEFKKLNKQQKKDVKVIQKFDQLFFFERNYHRLENVNNLKKKIKENGMNFKKYMALSEKKKQKLFKASKTIRDINLSINIQGGK